MWCPTSSTSICGGKGSTCLSRCARTGPLATRWHPASSPAGKRRSDVRGCDPLRAPEGRNRADLQGVQLVLPPTASTTAGRALRDRRAFLLGDAAHIHSPVGAQGMNTGLQDAYNLAWKLALVASGRADATLLNSYEDERLPIARRLLNTTDRAFSLVVSESWPREGGPLPTAREDPGTSHGGETRSEAGISDYFPDRYSLPQQSAIRNAEWPARGEPRARAIASRGCGSSSSRTVGPRICSVNSTIRALLWWYSGKRRLRADPGTRRSVCTFRRCRAIPRTTGSWRAPGFPGPLLLVASRRSHWACRGTARSRRREALRLGATPI